MVEPHDRLSHACHLGYLPMASIEPVRTGDRLSYHLQDAEECLANFYVALREDRDATGKLAGIVGLEDEHENAREMRTCLQSVNQRAKPCQQTLAFCFGDSGNNCALR